MRQCLVPPGRRLNKGRQQSKRTAMSEQGAGIKGQPKRTGCVVKGRARDWGGTETGTGHKGALTRERVAAAKAQKHRASTGAGAARHRLTTRTAGGWRSRKDGCVPGWVQIGAAACVSKHWGRRRVAAALRGGRGQENEQVAARGGLVYKEGVVVKEAAAVFRRQRAGAAGQHSQRAGAHLFVHAALVALTNR